MLTMRDIDYAAQAVLTALQQKFGRQNDLRDLKVEARERTIRVSLADQSFEGTRDELMSTLRKATDLEAFWSPAE